MSTWKTSDATGEPEKETRIKSISPPASGSRKLGTKLRFEIFKRDGFRCVYCGNRPPEYPLHVDHKIALNQGGTNQPDNLVTSCQPCNVGKRDVLLEEQPKFEKPVPDLPAAKRTKYPFDTFRLYGRKYRIYKRTKAASGSWYFQIEKEGRRFPTSLKTNCCATALERAKLLVEALNKDKFHAMRALVGGPSKLNTREFCTVEKYLQLYENTPTGDNTPRSRHHFVLAFRRIMAAGAVPARMDQLAGMFKEARARANAAIERAPDNAAVMRIKRSFSSEVANAASVISENAVFTLKEQLTLPDFTELRQLIKFNIRFPAAKKTASQYNPPPQKVLDATLQSWADLPRNEFIAVGLALACGMRRGEIRDYADWNWFEPHGGYLWCNARTGDFKDRTDVLRAQVLNPFWEMLMARVKKESWNLPAPGAGPGASRCIQGNRSEFDKNISAWMIKLGWETRLHLHALRAWAGSLVFMKYGVRAASEFCRHADEKTTKEHYGWLRCEWHTEDSPVIVAGKNVEWVKASPTAHSA